MSQPASFETVCRLTALEPRELERWIEARWVIPEGGAGAWVFREVDVARVRLILELRNDLEIDEAAMPVVLRLLDQLYEIRRRMKALAEALGTLPDEHRAAVEALLHESRED
jgi:chaperone modulatory protein CbpM